MFPSFSLVVNQPLTTAYKISHSLNRFVIKTLHYKINYNKIHLNLITNYVNEAAAQSHSSLPTPSALVQKSEPGKSILETSPSAQPPFQFHGRFEAARCRTGAVEGTSDQNRGWCPEAQSLTSCNPQNSAADHG